MGQTTMDETTVSPMMAREYIDDMLEELAVIARQAELNDLAAVLAVARVATRDGMPS